MVVVPVGREGKTNGGRKNCSSTTYIPRNISVRRKYLPALLKFVSSSPQRLGRGSLKPGGRGPEGVAVQRALDAKVTTAGR